MTHYSKALEQVRENWEVPPGMNAEFVKDVLPTPDQVIEHFEDKVQISNDDVETIALKDQPEMDKELFKMDMIDIRRFDHKMIAEANSNKEIEKPLKSLFKSMRNGNFQGAVSNGFMRINYSLPSGDTIDMVYDLRKGKSNPEGIKLSSFLQTNSSNEVLNLAKMLPNSDIKYKHVDWYWYLLRPALMVAGMSVQEDNVSIYKSFFEKDIYTSTLSPAVLFAHEQGHRWLKDKRPELIKDHTDYILSTLAFSGVDILSVLLAMGINPWFLLPSAITHISAYSLSRDLSTNYGKKAHASLASESHADYVEYVVADYLQRKGFHVGDNIKELETITNRFVVNYMLGYQPLAWGVVDVSRYMIDKANNNEGSVQNPSYAY